MSKKEQAFDWIIGFDDEDSVADKRRHRILKWLCRVTRRTPPLIAIDPEALIDRAVERIFKPKRLRSGELMPDLNLITAMSTKAEMKHVGAQFLRFSATMSYLTERNGMRPIRVETALFYMMSVLEEGIRS